MGLCSMMQLWMREACILYDLTQWTCGFNFELFLAMFIILYLWEKCDFLLKICLINSRGVLRAFTQ